MLRRVARWPRWIPLDPALAPRHTLHSTHTIFTWRRAHWLVAALALASCAESDADAPVETLTRFLEAMDRGNVHPGARKESYALLDREAQGHIAERARRAALVTGRDYEPWEMLAPGRFRMRFAPAEHSGMRATVTGDRALVEVRDRDGRHRAQIALVQQDGAWRIQLPVPAPRRDVAERVPPNSR
jgi:hypothetical protein